MKRIIVLFTVVSFAISGCEEKPPQINLKPEKPKVDTTYIATSVPTFGEAHNVLIEDFTGASCTNCPAAHDIVKGLESANPGRINAISLYIKDFPQTEPPLGHKYDFRSDIATLIQKSIFQSLNGMPIGGVDRLALGASSSTPLQLDPATWNSTVTNQLSIADSMDLTVSSTFDASTNKARINATVTYLYPTSRVHNISIVVVEDGFIDKQEDNRIPVSYLDTAYHFSSVLRSMVTTEPYGDVVAPKLTTKDKGLVYDVTYNYDWNNAWNPNNCRVIAFITDGQGAGGARVYQSKQAKVKP